jgi:hypothetical protein
MLDTVAVHPFPLAGAVTTALGHELAELEPPEFDAVTTARIVWPTSLDASV